MRYPLYGIGPIPANLEIIDKLNVSIIDRDVIEWYIVEISYRRD